jgi:hypothetical protein
MQAKTFQIAVKEPAVGAAAAGAVPRHLSAFTSAGLLGHFPGLLSAAK